MNRNEPAMRTVVAELAV